MPVIFKLENSGKAESSTDRLLIWTPTNGPNAGVACELRTCTEFSYTLGLAGDHIPLGNGIGVAATAHTEAKGQCSLGGIHAREWRRWLEHMGSALGSGRLQVIINTPGFPPDEYVFTGCILSGDWGEERNKGSLPVTGGDVLWATGTLNGKDLLANPDEVAT